MRFATSAPFLLAVSVWTSSLASADDTFKGGQVTWTAPTATTVEFSVQNVFRRDAYSTATGRCVSVVTLATVACTGADGNAGIGDVILEAEGGTVLHPGDGSPAIGSPLGPLLYLVTSVDPGSNWLYGLALDAAKLPTIDTTIGHTYAAAGVYRAAVESCCRFSLSAVPAGAMSHLNNATSRYRIETLVNMGEPNASPLTSMPPVTACPAGATCSLAVPVLDPNGDGVLYRLSKDHEAGGLTGFTHPNPITPTIDALTGMFMWDSTGAALAADRSAYSAQATVDSMTPAYFGPIPPPISGTIGVTDNISAAKVAIDWLIELVTPSGSAPAFAPGVPVGTIQQANVGVPFSLPITMVDPDEGDLLTLTAAGLPAGAQTTPALPLAASSGSVSATLMWTPSAEQQGLHLFTFAGIDSSGRQQYGAIAVNVGPAPPQVAVDILPRTCPNVVDAKAHGHLRVAIAGADDMDVTQIDLTSIRLAGVAPETTTYDDDATPYSPRLGKDSATSCTPAGADGILDIVMRFDRGAVVAALGTVNDGDVIAVPLTGTLIDATAFVGEDVVVIDKKKAKKTK